MGFCTAPVTLVVMGEANLTKHSYEALIQLRSHSRRTKVQKYLVKRTFTPKINYLLKEKLSKGLVLNNPIESHYVLKPVGLTVQCLRVKRSQSAIWPEEPSIKRLSTWNRSVQSLETASIRKGSRRTRIVKSEWTFSWGASPQMQSRSCF